MAILTTKSFADKLGEIKEIEIVQEDNSKFAQKLEEMLS